MIITQMSSVEFCPKCKTLLETKKQAEGAVTLKCTNCDYTSNITGRHMIRSKIYKDEHTATKIPYATIYDPAIRHTTRIKCLNERCPSLDSNNWGKTLSELNVPDLVDRGFKVEPKVMISTVYDTDRVATYICCICGYTFRPVV